MEVKVDIGIGFGWTITSHLKTSHDAVKGNQHVDVLR